MMFGIIGTNWGQQIGRGKEAPNENGGSGIAKAFYNLHS
jgi:hypothetical protein